jgi:predicted TIM-barrel fold metal-dependent hydrolase
MTGDFEAYLGPEGSVADLLKLEDDAGIEMVVLMPQIETRPPNDLVVAASNESDRIIPCACVNPNFGQEAYDDFEQLIHQQGMRGLKLMSPRHGYVISSRVCDPLMEISRELDVPVTVHSQGSPAHPLEIAELAGRHPSVPIIMDHMGHRYWVEQALQAAALRDNIYLGTTIASFEPGIIARAVAEVGAERVVFGSNAPSAHPDLAVASIQRAGLGDRALELVLGDNLARIYGLS